MSALGCTNHCFDACHFHLIYSDISYLYLLTELLWSSAWALVYFQRTTEARTTKFNRSNNIKHLLLSWAFSIVKRSGSDTYDQQIKIYNRIAEMLYYSNIQILIGMVLFFQFRRFYLGVSDDGHPLWLMNVEEDDVTSPCFPIEM